MPSLTSFPGSPSIGDLYSIGNVQWKYGLVVAVTFFVGAYFGSKLSLRLSPSLVKLLFGILMALVSIKLILSGYQSIVTNEN